MPSFYRHQSFVFLDRTGVIHASGFDTALDITRELLAKNQILCADRPGRAQERDDQPQDVKSYSDDCSRQLQHALIMPESARVCRCRMSQQPRRKLLRTTDYYFTALATSESKGAAFELFAVLRITTSGGSTLLPL